MKVYVNESNKLAYLLVAKNASSTFENLFKKLDWTPSQFDLLPQDFTVFSHIRDPIDRHFKGTAEFINNARLGHLLDDPDWQKVWATAVMDLHSYPLAWSVVGRTVEWIPIHERLDTNKITIEFLKKYNVVVDSVEHINASDYSKIKYYRRLKEIHEKFDPLCTLSYFYDGDIVLWNKAVEKYIQIPEYRRY